MKSLVSKLHLNLRKASKINYLVFVSWNQIKPMELMSKKWLKKCLMFIKLVN